MGYDSGIPQIFPHSITVTGDVEATGSVTGLKCGVAAFLSAQANTTITTALNYYPINGTFTNSPIECFGAATVHTPGIKYEGDKTQYFEIDWHATISANVAATAVILGAKKNGVLDSGSLMAQTCVLNTDIYNLSGTVVIELAKDDEIQLVVSSDGSGDIITFYKYTTTITEFFD